MKNNSNSKTGPAEDLRESRAMSIIASKSVFAHAACVFHCLPDFSNQLEWQVEDSLTSWPQRRPLMKKWEDSKTKTPCYRTG